MATIAEALAQGVQYQRAGQLDQAEQLYRQILQADPAQAEAWYRLGSVLQARGRLADATHCHQQALARRPAYAEPHNDLGIVLAMSGRPQEAVAHFREATRLAPTFADAFNNLGIVLGMLGQPDQGLAAFQQALTLRPGYVEAWNNQGKLLLDVGRPADAERCYRQALALRPASAEAYQGLGIAQRNLGRWAEAAASFRQAVQLRPNYADAFVNLGLTLLDLEQPAEAIECHRQALRVNPNSHIAETYLGIALKGQRRLDEAVAHLQQAIRLKPDHADAHNSLGNTLLEQGKYEEAIASFHTALRLRPDFAEAHNNLGNVFVELGRRGEALACFQQAIRLKPDYAEAHRNAALLLLLLGDFARGWAEFEWRWRCKDFPRRPFAQPRWDGTPLQGRTILLYGEQGYGDTLQFIRYASLVQQRGGTVVVECQPELASLVATCPGVARVIAPGISLSEFAYQAPILSLPGILRTLLDNVPAQVPYLSADPALVERWKRELESVQAFKVGIAWQGRPTHPGDRYRSIPLTQFAPLATVEGVRLFSLQVGTGSEQLANLAGRFLVTDLGNRFDRTSFADAAGVLRNLDLLITVDTALAHLAGALAVPVWVALPTAPDFRWLLEREDSPWYPTMHLFRQREPGNWGEVFERITGALQLAATRSRYSKKSTES
jgi:tetratricopeptide (TPR) repeat protein